MNGYDIDDVLADFAGGMYAYLNETRHESVRCHWTDKWIGDNFHRIEDDMNFWSTLPVLNSPGSLTVIPDVYVTARNIDSTISRRWLVENGFPDRRVISVGHHNSKLQVLQDLNVQLFVDDRPKTYRELDSGGINVVFYNPPYMKLDEEFDRHIYQIEDLQHYI